MAGTISFGGVGSGIDTEGIVSGLVGVARGQVSLLQKRATATHAAVSNLSTIGGLLSTLKSAVSGLTTVRDVGSYKATASGSEVVPSASGNALPGSYSIEVSQLAQAQRSYSNTFGKTALAQTGSIGIKVGTGTQYNVAVTGTDTLDSIAAKINATDAKVTASVLFDGTDYRLQISGVDTGAANGITLTETGTSLGLAVDPTAETLPTNTKQRAQDAKLKIDGFNVSGATNQIAGAIPGVSLAVTKVTTAPISLNIAADPDALRAKIQGVADAYNAVIGKIHTTAGFGSISASDPVLTGDSMLRTITNRMSNAVLTQIADGGTYKTLGSIGVQLDSSGNIKIDKAKLDAALSKDPESVAKVLGGDDTTKGAMDLLQSVVEGFTATGSGLMTVRKESLNSRATALDKAVSREEDRVSRYADSLRKQFTTMDSQVAASRSQLSLLTSYYG